jgi:hypothetical protein
MTRIELSASLRGAKPRKFYWPSSRFLPYLPCTTATELFLRREDSAARWDLGAPRCQDGRHKNQGRDQAQRLSPASAIDHFFRSPIVVAFCDRTGKHKWLSRALREAQARAEVCIVVCELPEDSEFFVQAEFLVASDHRDLFAHGLGDDLAVERVRVVQGKIE